MKNCKFIFYSIFILAILLRLALCLLNREANDDHMEAIAIIADTQSIPEASACAECFQPKFFYAFNAGILILLDVHDPVARIITLQFVNLIFTFLILLFIWKYLQSKSFSDQVKLMTFAVVALNPCLAGINAQITNDTMIILLGVLSIYYTDRFFQTTATRDGLLLILFVVLSAVVKGSGLVIVVAVLLIFSINILFSERVLRRRFLQIGFLLFILTSVIVPFAGGYYSNYIDSGTPFATGIGPNANVESSESFRWRPGIQSVQGGYLTFHLGGMIKQPYINDDPDVFPLHRTSVWSQLYGRTFFMHFDQHPPSWKSTSPIILNAGRIALILGLIPTLLFLIGITNSIKEFIYNSKFNIQHFFKTAEWHHLVFISGFVGFIVLYTRDYPDFSTMKSVFLMPAIPSFIFAFAKGWSLVKLPIIQKILTFLLMALIAVHVLDICFLIGQLS